MSVSPRRYNLRPGSAFRTLFRYGPLKSPEDRTVRAFVSMTSRGELLERPAHLVQFPFLAPEFGGTRESQ